MVGCRVFNVPSEKCNFITQFNDTSFPGVRLYESRLFYVVEVNGIFAGFYSLLVNFSAVADQSVAYGVCQVECLFKAVRVIECFNVISKKQGISGVIYYILVVIVCTVSLYMVTMLEEGFHFQPRIAFNLYHIQGMMLVVAFALVGGESDWNASVSKDSALKLGAYMVFAYIWIQMLFCSYIISGRFVSNALDKAYAQIILGEIDKYEQETGITVTKLNVTNDEYAPPYYDDTRIHYGQINERILGITTRSMFEAWFDRHFDGEEELPDDIYSEHFAGKDWDRFDVDEQLVIVGDTAYLCVY